MSVESEDQEEQPIAYWSSEIEVFERQAFITGYRQAMEKAFSRTMLAVCAVGFLGSFFGAAASHWTNQQQAAVRPTVIAPLDIPPTLPITEKQVGSDDVRVMIEDDTIKLTQSDGIRLPTNWRQNRHGKPLSTSLSPNRSRLAVSYMDGQVWLWNIAMRNAPTWADGWQVLPAKEGVVRTLTSYEVADDGEVQRHRLVISENLQPIPFLLTERFDKTAGKGGGYVLDVAVE